MLETKPTMITCHEHKNSNTTFVIAIISLSYQLFKEAYSMQIILSQEQIQEIQMIIANLIRQEIDNRLNKSGIKSPYLNKKQACEYLGISNNTLDSWIKKGLPVIRVGKTVRFNTDDLNYWLQNF